MSRSASSPVRATTSAAAWRRISATGPSAASEFGLAISAEVRGHSPASIVAYGRSTSRPRSCMMTEFSSAWMVPSPRPASRSSKDTSTGFAPRARNEFGVLRRVEGRHRDTGPIGEPRDRRLRAERVPDRPWNQGVLCTPSASTSFTAQRPRRSREPPAGALIGDQERGGQRTIANRLRAGEDGVRTHPRSASPSAIAFTRASSLSDSLPQQARVTSIFAPFERSATASANHATAGSRSGPPST